MTKEKLYTAGLVFVFTAGIILRLYFYVKNPSLWFDEAALAINIIDKSYPELFKGLDFLQASPACFTIIVKVLLDVLNPQTIWMRDLVLRFVPFISGVLALPAFYYLVKSVFENNKKLILTAMFFLAFNPCAILYSYQFKQYSTELLCSIILLILFYKMVMQNKFKWFYSVIIAITPWFSYSSFFIIAAGFAALFCKKKGFLYIIPLIISSIIYYFVSLKFVFAANYSGMENCWSHGYAFIDLRHPLRLLFRFGEPFAVGKILSALAGMLVFLSGIKYLFERDDILKKLLFCIPVILVIAASMLHKYAIQARLILFLVPVFIIVMVLLKDTMGKIITLLMALILCYSNFHYTTATPELSYSYARDIIQYLQNVIKPEDIILLDSNTGEYDLYLRNTGIKNEIIRLPLICGKIKLEPCRESISELPVGSYYFLSLSYYVKEITKDNGFIVKDLDLNFKPDYIKAVYLKKENIL